MSVIPVEIMREKRLKKIMGDDYDTKPALRLLLGKLEGVQAVEDMDGGRSVEWADLATERERKIAHIYYVKGHEDGRQGKGLIGNDPV